MVKTQDRLVFFLLCSINLSSLFRSANGSRLVNYLLLKHSMPPSSPSWPDINWELDCLAMLKSDKAKKTVCLLFSVRRQGERDFRTWMAGKHRKREKILCPCVHVDLFPLFRSIVGCGFICDDTPNNMDLFAQETHWVVGVCSSWHDPQGFPLSYLSLAFGAHFSQDMHVPRLELKHDMFHCSRKKEGFAKRLSCCDERLLPSSCRLD